MRAIQVAQKLYLLRDIIFQAANIKSELFQFLQQPENESLRGKVEAFSIELRTHLSHSGTRFLSASGRQLRRYLDEDSQGKLTTQLATFNDALEELKTHKVQPFVDYLISHPEVENIIDKHISTLEELYYAFNEGDVLLIEELDKLHFNEDNKFSVDPTISRQENDNSNNSLKIENKAQLVSPKEGKEDHIRNYLLNKFLWDKISLTQQDRNEFVSVAKDFFKNTIFRI